jgi:anti-sigma B factor antagonist
MRHVPCVAWSESINGQFRARLRGEVDLDRKEELRRLVADYRGADAVDATVDLFDVTFMDSTGVGALVALAKAAQERQGVVTLVGLQPIVRRVLHVTSVESWFRLPG